MKRVLIFSTAYLPLIGGAEVAVKEITDRIPDVKFVMFTARLDPKLPMVEHIGNVEVHRMGKGTALDKLRLIWQGPRQAHNLGKFDLVWSIMASYAGFAALCYKKRNPNVPYLLSLQEGDSKWDIYKHVWWCWPYFKQIFKKANHIQAISNYLATWAKRLGATCPVAVVPNGVDVDKFTVHSSQLTVRKEILEKLLIPSDAKVVITASRLVKKNGIGDLIAAMAKFSSEVHLLIAGTGELEAKLRKQTEYFGVKKKVHFLGNVSHMELPKYLWASDIFCRPSLSEGLGNAFLEAMVADLPVVATPVGGIPDFLKDGETGLFCKVGDSQDITEKINRIFSDQTLADKLRTNGRKLVQEKYYWEKIAAQMRNIFNNLSESASQSV